MRERELTSVHNARVKQARRLHRRRERETQGLFLVEGPHGVEVALAVQAPVQEVFCTEMFLERHEGLGRRLRGSPWPVWLLSEERMRGVAATEHSQGVVAVVCMPREIAELHVSQGFMALLLEGVGDPGNVGTAVRTAHATGASAVVLGPGCCDAWNPKAVRASAGGVLAVPVMRVADVPGLLSRLRGEGARVVAAEAGAGTVWWEAELAGPVVIAVGGEARGLSGEVAAAADARVRIPMPGGAESLNAAMAAGLLLYEALRQRRRGHGARPGRPA